MGEFHSPADYLKLAKSPDTSTAQLRELATVPWSFVLAAAAQNPRTEPEVLASLLPDHLEDPRERDIARALAGNSRTPEATLRLLAERLTPFLDRERHHGQEYEYRAAVLLCCNPSAPSDALAQLLTWSCTARTFRAIVAKTTRRPDVLDILAADRSETVRKIAQKARLDLSVARLSLPGDAP
jgi:hypothetical protein